MPSSIIRRPVLWLRAGLSSAKPPCRHEKVRRFTDQLKRASGHARPHDVRQEPVSEMKRIILVAAVAVLGLLSLVPAEALPRAESCSDEPSLGFSINAAILMCDGALSDFRTPSEDKARIYYHRGLLHHLQGQFALAIEDYTHALSWDKTSTDALEARGDAYEDLGDRDKAAVDYKQAGQFEEDDDDALNSRCWARAIRGHPLDRALADCNKAMQLNPGNIDLLEVVEILDSRCFVYYRMGNYAAAIADCSAVISRRDRYDTSLYVRGLSKIRSGDVAGGNADIAAAKDANYRIEDLYALYGVNP